MNGSAPTVESTLDVLEVLVVDCQSTGSHPRHGDVLELAWCRTTARDAVARLDAVESTLLALPAGRRIPRRITALTGIHDRDLRRGRPAAEAWRQLCRCAARRTACRAEPALDGSAAASGAAGLPAVAHFARFEQAFLQALHHEHGDGQPFPLQLICTYEIARRVLPALPRCSLRALGGYFGHPAREHKRAATHVQATMRIWAALVECLARHDVRDLPALEHWLACYTPPRDIPRAYALPREQRLALPDAPGIYRMCNRGGQVLYLGKAASLRRRVNSYFQQRSHGGKQVAELLTQTWRVDVTVAPSVLEAALMEVDEIKRLAPPYNVALRERDRSVWFADPQLSSMRPRPDARHAVGPVVARPQLEALLELQRWRVRGCPARPGAQRCRRMLALPHGARIDVECIRAGFGQFLHEVGPLGSAPAELLRLGARLWRRRRLCAPRTDDAGSAAAQRGDELRGGEWTADRVVATLEAVVMRAAHLLRRAHWLCQLSEATVAWRTTQGRRVLIIAGGDVIERADLPLDEPLPLPPGAARSRLERLRNLDARAHDRLRVLTTELRRELAEGSAVQIRGGAQHQLDQRALARRLRWV